MDLSSLKIAVIGDLILDSYYIGNSQRLSPEAPVPVVALEKKEDRLGGAANVAYNLAKLQVKTTLSGICGEDQAAASLAQLCNHSDIFLNIFRSVHTKTSHKIRVIAQNQQLLRIDDEAQEALQLPQAEKQLFLEQLFNAVKNNDAVIISDYAKHITALIPDVIQFAKDNGKYTIVDPKRADWAIYAGADCITPNLREFNECLRHEKEQTLNESAAAQFLCEKYNIRSILLTQGARGMTLFKASGQVHSVSALAKEVYDVTGAGDTVIAVYTASYLATQSEITAVENANKAASIVVGKLGTSTVTPADLFTEDAFPKILTRSQGAAFIEQARKHGKKVVFTNGCFDILHAGHIRYLNEARALGDALIVAVNSDDSIKALKGSDRPINTLAQRLEVLSALSCIDHLLFFEEASVLHTIETVKPDILVKGGDYTIDTVVGSTFVSSYGGQVCVLSEVPDLSTTATLARLQKSANKDKNHVA